MSNTSLGRHNIGAPIAKSGTKPPKRTGPRSGSFVGTGVNSKSAANAKYSGAQPRSGVNSQAETWLNQAPAPFDNSQPSSHPQKYQTGPSTKVGGAGGKTGAAGAMTGSAGFGSGPKSNFPAAATGPKGGLGQERGNVIGPSKPKKAGNVYNQPNGSSAGGYKGRGGAPSFYGR